MTRHRELPQLWRRLAAGVIDVGIAGAVSAGAIAFGALDLSRWTAASDLPAIERLATTFHATLGWTAAQWIVVWLPLVVLHALFGAAGRRTPGAWATGLVVVGPDGHPAGPVRGTVRGILYLSWPGTLLLAPLLVAVLPSQRGLHDVLSGTWVVRDPAAGARQRRQFMTASAVGVGRSAEDGVEG